MVAKKISLTIGLLFASNVFAVNRKRQGKLAPVVTQTCQKDKSTHTTFKKHKAFHRIRRHLDEHQVQSLFGGIFAYDLVMIPNELLGDQVQVCSPLADGKIHEAKFSDGVVVSVMFDRKNNVWRCSYAASRDKKD